MIIKPNKTCTSGAHDFWLMRDENIANQTWQESKFIEGTLVPRGGKIDMEKIHMKLESFLKRRPKEKIKKI